MIALQYNSVFELCCRIVLKFIRAFNELHVPPFLALGFFKLPIVTTILIIVKSHILMIVLYIPLFTPVNNDNNDINKYCHTFNIICAYFE